MSNEKVEKFREQVKKGMTEMSPEALCDIVKEGCNNPDPKVAIAALEFYFNTLMGAEDEQPKLTASEAVEVVKSFAKEAGKRPGGMELLNEAITYVRKMFPEQPPVNLMDVVGRYTELQVFGDNYVAICPFHRERTGSFTVKPNENSYHCFGCGVEGNSMEQFLEMIKDNSLQKGWA